MKVPNLKKLSKLAGMVQIYHQDKNLMTPFHLNTHQEKWLQLIINNERAIALKSRQVGFTTVSIYFIFALALVNPRSKFAIASDTQAKSKEILKKVIGWAADLQIKLKQSSAFSVTLPNGAQIDALTASSGHGTDSRIGRSATYSAVLLSEFSYYRDTEAVLASITSSMTPNGKLIIETTASAGDQILYSVWAGENKYAKFFVSVEDHPAYKKSEKHLDETDWLEAVEKFKFTDKRSASFWYDKLRNEFTGNVNRCLREYPIIPNHCFVAASGRFIEHDPPIRIGRERDGWKVYEEWKLDNTYISACDTSTGTGKDYSCILIWNLTTHSLAASWCYNDKLIDQLVSALRWSQANYHTKATYVEANGVSYATIAMARSKNIPIVDFTTTADTKYRGLLLAKRAIEKEQVSADDHLQMECRSLQLESRDGREKWIGNKDMLMTLGFCLLNEDAWKNVKPQRPQVPYGHFDMERALQKEAWRRKRATKR